MPRITGQIHLHEVWDVFEDARPSVCPQCNHWCRLSWWHQLYLVLQVLRNMCMALQLSFEASGSWCEDYAWSSVALLNVKDGSHPSFIQKPAATTSARGNFACVTLKYW